MARYGCSAIGVEVDIYDTHAIFSESFVQHMSPLGVFGMGR